MWPPDVGGPTTHAPEFCEYLLERGHRVTALTMADRKPAPRSYRVHWASRRLPIGARHALAVSVATRLARHADVVYSTGMIGRSSFSAAVAGTPLVLKLTSDPAFERSLRWGLCGPDLRAFQPADGLRIAALRRMRDHAIRHAAHVVTPSDSLRQLALSWGVPADKLTLLANPVAAPAELAEREELRRRHRLDGPSLVFAGRLVPQKSIDVALEAVCRNDDVSLVVAGEGPERTALERHARSLGLNGRARFLGAQPRQTVFELLKAADAAVLSSSWENFPHVVVEALSVGTPVLATDAGGVTEVVRDGWNGLVVPTANAEALGNAIRRYFDQPALRRHLRANAAESVASLAPPAVYAELERILLEEARRR